MNLDLIERQAISGELACHTWRLHNNHRQETKAVKIALLEAGYTNVKVGHGTGTASCWLKIHCDAKPGQTWQQKNNDVEHITQQVTGRHGDYGGRINIS